MLDFLNHLLEEFKLPLENPVLVFSLILFIILLSPIILRKINIPSIIGLIIAGVVIGPHGFYILEKNSAIDLFSTIGLLYIMFIAGLELDLNEFKTHRKQSLLFGFFTFTLPLIIGLPICYFFLGYEFNASFLTASMFATHTLVAYPLVSKFGVSKNPAVAITVGGTILTDTAVLIILAVIMASQQGGLTSEFWIRLTVSLVIFSVIMFLVIPVIAKWFFRKLESEKHSHYIFVLSVVFFSAFLAEMAGVEPIIGAFVAGLSLNKLIPHSSALMNRIEFIGNSLFIPFFLISVGMLVDISVILNGTTAILVAMTLSVVALSGKWLAAFFTQLVFRYSKTQRKLIFGLSSAHAAATLAIILVGYKANIIDDNILNGTIILILITCIVASFATEKAAKNLVLEEDNNTESTISKSLSLSKEKHEQILLPIGQISSLEKLLEFAIFIKDKKSPNPVSILSVVSNNEEAEVNILKTRNKLEEYVKQASASEVLANVIATIDHNPASGIVRISKETMTDMIILGWPQRSGFFDKLFGEKLDNILANTDKTTFVCHFEKPLALHKRILIFAPPLTEHEDGFELWLGKMVRLAQELSVSIHLYCNMNTAKASKALNSSFRNSNSGSINIQNFDDWDDILIMAREIQKDDLIVLVSAKKGSTSYYSNLENLPSKLEKYFPKVSRFVIYPQQNSFITDGNFEDISNEALNKGIETVQKIGKEIGNIFKRKPE